MDQPLLFVLALVAHVNGAIQGYPLVEPIFLCPRLTCSELRMLSVSLLFACYKLGPLLDTDASSGPLLCSTCLRGWCAQGQICYYYLSSSMRILRGRCLLTRMTTFNYGSRREFLFCCHVLNLVDPSSHMWTHAGHEYLSSALCGSCFGLLGFSCLSRLAKSGRSLGGKPKLIGRQEPCNLPRRGLGTFLRPGDRAI